ncbi:MAG: hypothetical protein ACI4BD_06665 [Paludibacteraceae bacterium]
MKRRNSLVILFTMLTLCISGSVGAQVSYNPAYAGGSVHRLTVGLDALYYYGDICPVKDHPMSIPPRKENWGGGLNLSYTYQVIPQLGLRTTVSGGYLRGAVYDESSEDWIAKGKVPKATADTFSLGAFQSGFGELDFGVEWYPIPNAEGGLYIYVGVGCYLGAVKCAFENALRNPVENGNWRTCITPVAIGELGYSFRLQDGHTLTVKGSLHNALLNVNSKHANIGYNMDGWGRGALDKADFTYTSSSIKYEQSGNSAWGQFTDGYFTVGVAYTFNVGDTRTTNNRLIYQKGSNSKNANRNSFARANTVNKKASAYKKKVSKKRNKAFQNKNKKGGRIAW